MQSVGGVHPLKLSQNSLTNVGAALAIVCALVAFVGVGAFGPTRPVRIVIFSLAAAACLPFFYSGVVHFWSILVLVRQRAKQIQPELGAWARYRFVLVVGALCLYSFLFALVPAVILGICAWQLSVAIVP